MQIAPPLSRCFWVTKGDALYEAYHDLEWGVPVHEDRDHFALLTLEAAQSGLSWITILRRREGYKKAFADFDPGIVATFGEEKIQALLQDPGIIRNEKKIRSTIVNARAFLQIQKEFGSFDSYVWSFVDFVPQKKGGKDLASQSEESVRLSQDLKKRGFSFLGPVTIYSYMQAAGLVNDHTPDCFCYKP